MESPCWALVCYFDGLSDNRALQSTSWSNLSLQVYTRASSCEWALKKYAPFEVRVTYCTWTAAPIHLYVVACLVLIPVYFELFSTLNKRAWAARIWQSGRSWMAFRLSKPTQISHPPPSNHQLGLPSSAIKCCSKCFWYDGYVLSVLKPFLKRVLHVLRRTILGQYLRVNVLRSFVVYLGQGCLSGSRLSVSRTPCTAS